MRTIRTKNRTYLPPSFDEMKEVAENFEVSKFPSTLVEDFCNILAGGVEYSTPSEMEKNLRAQISQNFDEIFKLDKDGDFSTRYPEMSGYFQDRQSAIENLVETRLRKHQNTQEFLQSINWEEWEDVGGDSPLQKAMAFWKVISTSDAVEAEEDVDGDIVGNNGGNPHENASQINEDMDLANLTGDEDELLDYEEKDYVEVLQEVSEGQLRALMKIKRELDKKSLFRARSRKKSYPSPEGNDVRVRPIRRMGELPRAQATEHALPRRYRDYRLATGKTMVREKIEKKEQKQLLYLLVDSSGSMQGENFSKAGGVVLNRLEAVLDGDAELWLSMFDEKIRRTWEARAPKQSKEVMSRIRDKNNFFGGGTEIDGCLRSAVVDIKEKMKKESGLINPELVIITDGNDAVSASIQDLKGIRLHAFLLGEENQELIELARQSGGIGLDNL